MKMPVDGIVYYLVYLIRETTDALLAAVNSAKFNIAFFLFNKVRCVFFHTFFIRPSGKYFATLHIGAEYPLICGYG